MQTRRFAAAFALFWLAAGPLIGGCASWGTPSAASQATSESPADSPRPVTGSIEATPSDAAATSESSDWPARTPAASERSVHGFDRADWPQVPFSAGAGRTLHYPVYFERAPDARHLVASEVLNQPTLPGRLEAALSGAEPDNWSWYNAKREGKELAFFGWEFITWPYAAVKRPPWTVVATPPLLRDSVRQAETHPPSTSDSAATQPSGEPWDE